MSNYKRPHGMADTYQREPFANEALLEMLALIRRVEQRLESIDIKAAKIIAMLEDKP